MSKPGKVLKGLCKKLGVRLTVKRGQKRVYKSVAVLKAQCKKKVKKKKVKKKKVKKKKVKKKKVKKKKVKRRKAKFGASRINFDEPLYDYVENHSMSDLNNQMIKTLDAIQSIDDFKVPLNYFDSGYNPFDVHEFSKNLMNDSINDPRKMIDLIMSSFEMEDDLGSKGIHYLLHNKFFKNSNGVAPEADLLSDYMLGNYHKKVPFKREDGGEMLLRKAVQVCLTNEEDIDENQVRIRAKRYLWHDDLYNINWNNHNSEVVPILTGVKTEKCLRREAIIEFIRENERFPDISDADRDDIIDRTQQKFGKPANWGNRIPVSQIPDNRQPIPVDQILQEINDRELRAVSFFIKQHLSIYTDQVIAENNNRLQQNNNRLQRRWGEYIYIDRGGRSILLDTFLVRVLQEYVRLCHTLRVYSINLGTTQVTKRDTGVSTYHFWNPELRLCSCLSFYFNGFNQLIPRYSNLRDNSVISPISQRYTMSPRMLARRMCKHLSHAPNTPDDRGRGGEVFTVNNDIELLLPGSRIENEDGTTDDNITPTQQMLYNVIKLRHPESLINMGINLHDLRYFGSINVIERQLYELLPINNPGVQPRREIITPEVLVRRNSKKGFVDVDGRRNSCYLCLSEKPFLLKNCPGNCVESLICLDCIKNYPVNWDNRRIYGNTRIKCGFCRGTLSNIQTTDFESMRTNPNFDEDRFNELSYDLYPEMRNLQNLTDELPRGGFFGKKKKKVGIPTSLKKVCKRLKIRLTVKRKGKRVYKSVKVLKGQCKKALKKKKKVVRKSKVGKKKKKVLRKSKAGKKVKKKISVSLKNKCKKYGIRLTFKKGNKKVPKSEKLLIKQLKKKEIVLKKKGDNAIKKLIKKVKILKKKEIKRRKEKGITKKINKKDIKRMVQASKPPSMMGRIWKQIKRTVVFLFMVLAETGRRRREKEERLKTISAQIRHLNNEHYSISRDLEGPRERRLRRERLRRLRRR